MQPSPCQEGHSIRKDAPPVRMFHQEGCCIGKHTPLGRTFYQRGCSTWKDVPPGSSRVWDSTWWLPKQKHLSWCNWMCFNCHLLLQSNQVICASSLWDTSSLWVTLRSKIALWISLWTFPPAHRLVMCTGPLTYGSISYKQVSCFSRGMQRAWRLKESAGVRYCKEAHAIEHCHCKHLAKLFYGAGTTA